MIVYINATWIHACDEKSVFDLTILNIWFVFSNSRTGCTFLWINIMFTIMLLLWSCMYMETRHISIKLFFHWKQKIVNLTALSSLVALYVVVMANYGANWSNWLSYVFSVKSCDCVVACHSMVKRSSYDDLYNPPFVLELLYRCPFTYTCPNVVSRSS